jgi:ribosomal protein S12
LGVIGIVPSGALAKVAMKAKMPNSFARKEVKTKRMQPWLHEMEVS